MAVPARVESASSFASGPFAKRLERRVLRFVQQQGLFQPGERVIVGVSGGTDSTALLVILSRLREQLSLKLFIVHFNHMLRSSEEAKEDVAFVEAMASAVDLRLFTAAGNVGAAARLNRESLESAARRSRYELFRKVANQHRASVVTLGHTRDDQAETVLLHVLRGSGVEGLSGMRPRAPWPFGDGPDVARPLLCLRRHETERYCRELGVEPRRDPTNDLLIATRNRIRHKLLPAMGEFNPRIEDALARLAEAAALDVGFIDRAAEDAWQRLAELEMDRVSLPRAELAALHPAITSRIVRRTVAHLLGSSADLEAIHIEQIRASLAKRRCRLSLPHGLTAVVDVRSLSIAKGFPTPVPPIAETALAVPGCTQVGHWLVEAEIVPRPADPAGADALEAYLDAEASGRRLAVRSRRPGDRLRPLGLGGDKKVQDILVDAKVPVEERNSVPLVCENIDVVWVVGHRINEKYALQPDSVTALRLRFSLRGS